MHRNLMVAVILVWTLLVAGFWGWSVHQSRKHIDSMAVHEARTHFSKDLAIRLWATEHGGVYVPADERTPPNPGLAHIPERDLEPPWGGKLTLMNPAYVVRQVMEEFQDLYGVQGRIVGLAPINPDNAPDEWEQSALQRFKSDGAQEVQERVEIDGKEYLRLIRPMITRKECLRCHAYQGYSPGDIQGGIGVAVPYDPYIELYNESLWSKAVSFGAVWLAGLGGIFFTAVQINKRLVQQEEYESELHSKSVELARANTDLVRFARVAAHHLMEPARRLVSYSRRLRSNLSRETDQENLLALNYIEQSSVRLSYLVRDIQLYLVVREPRGETGWQDTDRVLADVLDGFASLIQETGAKIRAENLPRVYLDRPRLFDILTELLKNAMVHARPDQKPDIRVSGEQRGEASILRISDNGPGIPQEYRERIFEVFERLQAGGTATGIGLAVVRRIMESRHGHIRVEDNVAGGMDLILEFPGPGQEMNNINRTGPRMDRYGA